MIQLSATPSGTIGETWFSELYVSALALAFTGGILVRTSEGDLVAFFRQGHPLHAGGPGFKKDFLGEILVQSGGCTKEQLVQALERQASDPARALLGAYLVSTGSDPNAVKAAVQTQTQARIDHMIALAQGSWQAAPGESARVRDIGVPINNVREIFFRQLLEHMSDAELKKLADRYLGHAVQLSPTLALPEGLLPEDAQQVIKYLSKPRKPDQLERAVEGRRLVRVTLKVLDLLGHLEQHPAARAIPIPKATLLKGVSFPMSSSAGAPISSPETPVSSTSKAPLPVEPAPKGPTSSRTNIPLEDAPIGGAPNVPGPSRSPVSSQSNRPISSPSGLGGMSGGDITTLLAKKQEETQLMKEVRALHEELGKKNHFELFGLERNHDASTLRKTYTMLAKKFHPDAFGPDTPADVRNAVKEISARINEAYEVLSDPESRTNYVALLDDKRFLGDARKAARTRDAEVKGQMGIVMLRKRDFKKARDLFSVAMEADPASPMHKAHYAWALFSDPQEARGPATEKARALMSEVMEDKDAKRNPTLLCYLGQIQKAEGDMKTALQTFKSAAAIDPKNTEAQREVRLLSGRIDKEKTKDLEKKGSLSKLFKR